MTQMSRFRRNMLMPRLTSCLLRAIAASVAFVAITAQIGSSWAQTIDGATSAYTSAPDKACKVLSRTKVDGDDYASTRVCKGYKDFVLTKADNDLRSAVSVGRTAKAAQNEPAASQTFGAFNSPADTVEWRLDKSGKPFAIIQRWSIADNDDVGKDDRPKSKYFLIVTKVAPGATCHVAYVDSQANGHDANAVARKAADELAGSFDCKKGKITIAGKPGRATKLALRSE